MASASAASSGLGISLRWRSIWRAFWTWGFFANPFPAIPCFTWSGVNSMRRIPALASVCTITPRACATSIPFVTFLRKNNRSTPQISGLYVSISSLRSAPICTSRSGKSIPARVSMTPYSRIRRFLPSFSRRAKPTVASHGSIPSIIIENSI